MTSDPVAVAQGKTPFAAAAYVGRWEINNGFLRLLKPNTLTAAGGNMTVVFRLQIANDGRLLLYDAIERLDQALVYRRLPIEERTADPNESLPQRAASK